MRRNEGRAVGSDELDAMSRYLKGYGFQSKLLRLARYERSYFGGKADEEAGYGEPVLARARMFEIRHFIMSLPNGDEKLLLYYHYVQGHSIERCAELLGGARASGYRLKKRALAMAVRYREEHCDARKERIG